MIVCENQKFTTPTGRERYGYYLDNYLVANLDFLKLMVEKKWDGVGIISGQVGSGKTTWSHAAMHYLDPTFNLDRVVFSGKELMEAIDKAEKGQGIIFDEAVMALSSQDFATDLQKSLIKKFTMIRSKNLFIFLIIPNFFMMRKWFCVDRTKFMVYTYSPDGITRGYAKFYSWNRKKELYLRGYKYMDMGIVSPNFAFRFTNTEGYFLDMDAYEAKKQAAIKALTDDGKQSDKEKLQENFKDKVLKLNIQNKQWKENLKDKYMTKWQTWKAKYRELKEKYDSQINAYKEQAIDLQKSKDKDKIKELERNISKLTYFTHLKMKEYWKFKTGQDMSKELYLKMLEEESILEDKNSKEYYKSGEQLIQLIT